MIYVALLVCEATPTSQPLTSLLARDKFNKVINLNKGYGLNGCQINSDFFQHD